MEFRHLGKLNAGSRDSHASGFILTTTVVTGRPPPVAILAALLPRGPCIENQPNLADNRRVVIISGPSSLKAKKLHQCADLDNKGHEKPT